MPSAHADTRGTSALPLALILLHLALLAWAVIGLAEWLLPAVPWPPLSNPLFPRWVLLLHWLAIGLAALAFLGGYATRWPGTPRAMVAAYAFMAAVCAIETFGFLVHELRFLAMALEYVAYLVLSVAMFRAPSLAARFR